MSLCPSVDGLAFANYQQDSSDAVPGFVQGAADGRTTVGDIGRRRHWKEVQVVLKEAAFKEAALECGTC